MVSLFCQGVFGQGEFLKYLYRSEVERYRIKGNSWEKFGCRMDIGVINAEVSLVKDDASQVIPVDGEAMMPSCME